MQPFPHHGYEGVDPPSFTGRIERRCDDYVIAGVDAPPDGSCFGRGDVGLVVAYGDLGHAINMARWKRRLIHVRGAWVRGIAPEDRRRIAEFAPVIEVVDACRLGVRQAARFRQAHDPS